MKDAVGTVKVGHTYDLPMRLHRLRYQITNDRRPLKLVRAVEMPLGAMRAVERRTHKLLAHCQVDLEWFTTSHSAASRALNEAIRYEGALKKYVQSLPKCSGK